ncbi:MAG: ATP synthase F1 subunit gamma, partial [Cyanobacteriota bacterium]|nr:ATP synthase F1 subunit gamma [Cyanobacteriota bacterium]
MANLKDIRDRIVSVKNTRKITEAMRLVAAAKVRRAQEQVLRSRPFADRLARVLENIQSRMSFEMADAPLLKTSDLKTITLLAVTGDRGLCGGYNSNIIKRTEQRYAELNGQGYKVDLVLIGRKAITYFSNRSSQYTIRATFTGLEQVPTSDDAESITTEVLAEFLSQSTDRIEVIYTKFINLVSCNPVVQTLLPLDPQGIAEADDEIFRLTTKDSRLTVEKGVGPANEQPPLPSDIIFEQSPEQLLNALLPLYLQNQMLRALQES